jgi:hypothetical protein
MTLSPLALVAGVLATVFLVSGSLKARRPFAAALALTRFGVLRRVRPSAGRAVGVLELVLGMSLLAMPGSPVPFVTAALLLSLFTFLIGRALLRGERFACSCFAESGGALSWRTLVRTAALLAGAVAGAALTLRPAPEVLAVEQRLAGLILGVLVFGAALLAAELLRTRPFSATVEAGR